jgi:hypothetical protein
MVNPGVPQENRDIHRNSSIIQDHSRMASLIAMGKKHHHDWQWGLVVSGSSHLDLKARSNPEDMYI